MRMMLMYVIEVRRSSADAADADDVRYRSGEVQ